MNRSYTIPPEQSSINITIDIIDDSLVESDGVVTITLTATASGYPLRSNERSRTISVTILDDEGNH